jgi:hypothetical protein
MQKDHILLADLRQKRFYNERCGHNCRHMLAKTVSILITFIAQSAWWLDASC